MRALAVGILVAAVSDPVGAAEIHVDGDAAPGGDGSEARPFDSLAGAEGASAPGDRIVVGPSSRCLGGGIALKCDQRLEGAAGQEPPCITNDAGHGITLAPGARVTGLHIDRPAWSGVIGVNLHARRAGCGAPGAEVVDIELAGLRITSPNRAGGITDEEAAIYGPLSSSGITLVESSGVTHYAIADVEIVLPRGNGLAIFAQEGASISARVERSAISDQRLVQAIDTAVLAYAEDASSTVKLVFVDGTILRAGRSSREGRGMVCGADLGGSTTCVLERSWVADAGQDNVLGIIASDQGEVSLEIADSLLEGATNVELVSWHIFGSSLESRLSARVTSSVLRRARGANLLVTENGDEATGTFEVFLEDSELTGGSAGFWVQSIPFEGLRSKHVIDLGGGDLGSRGGNRILHNDRWADVLVEGPVHVSARHNCIGTVELTTFTGELGSVDRSHPSCPSTRP